MTAQPLPREALIELVTEIPVRSTRSKTSTKTTDKKPAVAKTAIKAATKTAAKSTSKTVAKTATTRQRSATKAVEIVDFPLPANVQALPLNRRSTADAILADSVLMEELQHCRQSLSSILTESRKLTQTMEDLAAIALQIQQLKRPTFEHIPCITPIATPIVEPIAQPIVESIAEPQRPSRIQSRITVRKPIPPYNPSLQRSLDRLDQPAVAPNYWGGNVQAPTPRTPPIPRDDRLDLPSLPPRPAQPVLHRLAQQQLAPSAAKPTPIQHSSSTFQRLIPIPTQPGAIVFDATVWTLGSVCVHVILQVFIKLIPALSVPLNLVMLFPALFAAYLAFCVPKASTPSVYRCLLVTLGFFFGSKL